MGEETKSGPNANLAFIWVSIAGATGSAVVSALGGRFTAGWPLAAMVAAPAIMALGIAILISRAR